MGTESRTESEKLKCNYLKILEAKAEEYIKGGYCEDDEFKVLVGHECMLEGLVKLFIIHGWNKEITTLSKIYFFNKELIELYLGEYPTYAEILKYLLMMGNARDETEKLLNKLKIIECCDIFSGTKEKVVKTKFDPVLQTLEQIFNTYEIFFKNVMYEIKKNKVVNV